MKTGSPLKEMDVEMFDPESYRQDFPLLQTDVYGKPFVYLDNGATSQKPQIVIDRIQRYYQQENANIHRGVYRLSMDATKAYEGARGIVRRFLNASEDREIVFVRGATEGINMVAHSFVRPLVTQGDEILVTHLEHHSNIVPWQILCEETGAILKVIPINDEGECLLDDLDSLLNERTRFVSVIHVSNAIGTVNPIQNIIDAAHERDIPVMIDGAQSAPHMAVDVRELDCDFFVFSGHKIFAPTGIGALYAKAKHLEAMKPYQGGGDMIKSVTFAKTIYNDIPYKFEAGTPHICGAIALGEALSYVSRIGMDRIEAYERDLMEYGTAQLLTVPGLKIIGTSKHKAGAISFVLDGIHPHDIGTIVDREGVAIRTGHHCAQPVMDHFRVPATARASFAFYNTREDLDRLISSLHKVIEVFG